MFFLPWLKIKTEQKQMKAVVVCMKSKITDCCFSFCYYSVAIPENALFLRSPLILVVCLSQILNTKRKVGEPGKKASPEIFPHGEILISNGMSSQYDIHSTNFHQTPSLSSSFPNPPPSLTLWPADFCLPTYMTGPLRKHHQPPAVL